MLFHFPNRAMKSFAERHCMATVSCRTVQHFYFSLLLPLAYRAIAAKLATKRNQKNVPQYYSTSSAKFIAYRYHMFTPLQP